MKITLFLSSLWLALASVFVSDEKVVFSGQISDEKGAALVGATVKILKNRGLIQQTNTDAKGKYRFELEPGGYDIECAYPSYVTRRITGIQVQAKQETVFHISLESGALLDEVVVENYKTAVATYGKATGSELVKSEALMLLSAPEPSDAVKREPTGRDDSRAKRTDVPTTAAPKSKGKPAAKRAAEKADLDASFSKPTTVTILPVSGEPAPVPVADGPAPVKYKAAEIDADAKKDHSAFSPDLMYEEKIEVAGDKTTPPPPGTRTQPTPRAGLLTAGEWNDLHNWAQHWTDLLTDGEIDAYQKMYGFFPKNRYTVLVTNEQDFPIADAAVMLKRADGETIWESRTDNTGKAELWADLFNPSPNPEGVGHLISVEALVNGQKHELSQPKLAKDGLNRFKINAVCTSPKNVDIVWAVDATGSMGDEIEYLKTELLDVIGRAKGRNSSLQFRMGTVFYRDVTDPYITKSSGLSPDISKTVEFIKKQSADGGGDYPEAVHSALEEAVFGQKWNEDAIARICFLVLDASPHQSPEVNASLQKSIREAARLGIRIVPVTASGIQKDTEFLMKFFGLATNGTYVFLTDHSGIGGKHLEPTTDEYKVEPLNELLVRLITEYTTIETCEGKSLIRFEDDPQGQNGNGQNATWQAFYYPNPASTQFTLELPFDVQSVTIYNSEGKAVRKLEKPQAGQNTVVVSDLSEGFYTIRILKEGRMQSGKLMVVRA